MKFPAVTGELYPSTTIVTFPSTLPLPFGFFAVAKHDNIQNAQNDGINTILKNTKRKRKVFFLATTWCLAEQPLVPSPNINHLYRYRIPTIVSLPNINHCIATEYQPWYRHRISTIVSLPNVNYGIATEYQPWYRCRISTTVSLPNINHGIATEYQPLYRYRTSTMAPLSNINHCIVGIPFYFVFKIFSV